jgi:hypothetical protein
MALDVAHDDLMGGDSGRLIAVDGISRASVIAAARAAAARGARRAKISWWDASGLFEQLAVADRGAGLPSARTLLLLYAADLAFRLRWEIEPKLAEGRVIVAAPYVDTAVAFGRAAGLSAGWLANLFHFARPAGVRRVAAAKRGTTSRHEGFVEFACKRVSERGFGLTPAQLASRTQAHLLVLAERSRGDATVRRTGANGSSGNGRHSTQAGSAGRFQAEDVT